MSDTTLAWVIFLAVLLLIAGCSWGPIQVTHEYGHMPKGHVNLPLGAKLRPVQDSETSIDGVSIVWKRSFE
jgi:hypothetical protein